MPRYYSAEYALYESGRKAARKKKAELLELIKKYRTDDSKESVKTMKSIRSLLSSVV